MNLKHPGSQNIKGRRYQGILADSAELASWLAPLVKVDKLDGASVSEQV